MLAVPLFVAAVYRFAPRDGKEGVDGSSPSEGFVV
jgi:hypothetical protein